MAILGNYNLGKYGIIAEKAPINNTNLLQDVGSIWNDITGVTAQNAFNAQEAEKQRQYETQMSNTAYQRAVADMQAAGLNPAMMFSSGANAASTPTGATAHGTGNGAAGAGILINSFANVAKVLNNDKDNNNNTGLGSIINAAIKIAKYIK